MSAILMAIILIAYTLAVIIKNRGIPPSYSSTFYLWKGKPFLWLFLTSMIILSILSCPTLFIFIAVIGLAMVATADNYKLSENHNAIIINTMHLSGSYLTILMVLLSMTFDMNAYVIVGINILIDVILLSRIFKIKNEIFWVEVNSFAMFILSLLIYK